MKKTILTLVVMSALSLSLTAMQHRVSIPPVEPKPVPLPKASPDKTVKYSFSIKDGHLWMQEIH